MIKEDPAVVGRQRFKQQSISPSRKDEIRRLERANTQTLTKQQKLAGKRQSMKVTNSNCFALLAGDNAAMEEVLAEERDIRREDADREFYSKIKRAVDRRTHLKSLTVRN